MKVKTTSHNITICATPTYGGLGLQQTFGLTVRPA